uniref:Uncharacterized protein n=1 Tax=Octopus bimaculoides TaxID=37653 RepID=A0A0L8IGS1_OCTBM
MSKYECVCGRVRMRKRCWEKDICLGECANEKQRTCTCVTENERGMEKKKERVCMCVWKKEGMPVCMKKRACVCVKERTYTTACQRERETDRGEESACVCTLYRQHKSPFGLAKLPTSVSS